MSNSPQIHQFAFRKPRVFMLTGQHGKGDRLAYEYGGAFKQADGKSYRQEGYTTVMIPLTPTQRRNSNKKVHFQVVRNSRLREMKDNAFLILRSLRS